MRAMVSSVKDKGVTQPAIVRPREDGGYEIVSGHRRQKASELAGYADMPCIVRNLTDDTSGQIDPKDAGKRSNEIVAERNKMAVKQVQRYIRLNELVPDLMKLMDEKKLGFTTAVELSYIGKKNQNYIAVAIDSQQSSPSQAQAKRMRELDEKKLLNGDVIDGITDHQAAGRLEGPAEGTRKAGEENRAGKVSRNFGSRWPEDCGALPRAPKLWRYKLFPVASYSVA